MCSEFVLHSSKIRKHIFTREIDNADTHIMDEFKEHNTSHLPDFVLTQIVAKMHFFDLSDAVVTFVAHNSFGRASIGDVCKTLTLRFVTEINVSVSGKNVCPPLLRNHPPG